MRVIFFGSTSFGYECCRHIIENKLAEVVSIVTIPESFRISYSDKPVKNVTYSDMHEIGKMYNINVIEISDNIRNHLDELRQYNPDLIIVAGWFHKVPKAVRELAPKGCIGFHASLLPKYRGGAPLVWAMINGEKETGISLFYFEEGIDEGDIIAQKRIGIEENDNIRTLIEKTKNLALEILTEYIPMISEGTAPRIPQDHTQATYFPQRKPEDGEIDWSWDAERIKNFIRAQTKPYPGAYTIINGKKITIWEADIEEI
ncbi:MAG: methionyl-tRNA formyltransferase [Ignavibacteria bacterium]|nr:methionyl-tRNA formyltransferase [Ignavibacteria bacterium]